jgi:hypothetical protein
MLGDVRMGVGGDASDFDFQVGEWEVHHRRLIGRLVDSTDWEEFSGTCSMRKILGGHGNIEDNLLHFRTGSYRAAAMRSFDPDAGTWAIWWLDARNPHRLDVPVVGGFEDGVGTFYADDVLDGRAIRVRFTWSETNSDTPVWEQAFSRDAGVSWEINWLMRFTRVA